MTKPCNHRGSNVTDSKLPQCTYEYNSCSGENEGSLSSRRKRSEGEGGECLTEANGWEYRGSVSETASGQCCMKWSVKGNGYETGNYVDEYGTGDHNFCRNPS